ncbi:hypothetical protein B0T18DRAFT_91613 [Schizothecium vesticola]|uniref:Uncharacterized protein n=1 Tax=Schizothecium vesticola TaxID=314040 RepID=A0AA40KBD9_9PEZI|nr:hypothetical protein B0T18DRAFT_91613 [Schizothecium vesticola]
MTYLPDIVLCKSMHLSHKFGIFAISEKAKAMLQIHCPALARYAQAADAPVPPATRPQTPSTAARRTRQGPMESENRDALSESRDHVKSQFDFFNVVVLDQSVFPSPPRILAHCLFRRRAPWSIALSFRCVTTHFFSFAPFPSPLHHSFPLPRSSCPLLPPTLDTLLIIVWSCHWMLSLSLV